MEQLTLLQNQFTVDEVQIDIMFKYKLFIINLNTIYSYNIYIYIHICDNTQNNILPVL